MFYWLLVYIYNVNMRLYKSMLFFYNYITSYDRIIFIKNSKKINSITNLYLNDEDQLIFEYKSKKFSLIKKKYNETSKIIHRIYDENGIKGVSISKILFIKHIECDNKLNYSDDELLKFILMYYGPSNNLYNNIYDIKLRDVRDDKNNDLLIRKINYIDNNFNKKELTGDDYLI